MDLIDESLPAVIILDMLLAAETGMALLNEVKGYDDLAGVPIIVCSSVGDLDIADLEPYGVVATVDKSMVDPEEMSYLLRRYAGVEQ